MIVLEDLVFDPRYFHSATLRITIPPRAAKGPEEAPGLYVVITLFTPNGLKDFGISSHSGVQGTLNLYQSLLAQLGSPMAPEPFAALCQEKTAQLQAALQRHHELTANPEPASQGAAPSRGHAL